MELWMKIGSAILLGGMLLLMFPNARHWLRESPAAQPGDWPAFIAPLLAVGGFVALLMWLV